MNICKIYIVNSLDEAEEQVSSLISSSSSSSWSPSSMLLISENAWLWIIRRTNAEEEKQCALRFDFDSSFQGAIYAYCKTVDFAEIDSLATLCFNKSFGLVLGHNSVNVQSKLNLNITVLLQQSVGFIIFCFLLFKQTLNLSSLHASTYHRQVKKHGV